jgi:hypothetical protein
MRAGACGTKLLNITPWRLGLVVMNAKMDAGWRRQGLDLLKLLGANGGRQSSPATSIESTKAHTPSLIRSKTLLGSATKMWASVFGNKMLHLGGRSSCIASAARAVSLDRRAGRGLLAGSAGACARYWPGMWPVRAAGVRALGTLDICVWDLYFTETGAILMT